MAKPIKVPSDFSATQDFIRVDENPDNRDFVFTICLPTDGRTIRRQLRVHDPKFLVVILDQLQQMKGLFEESMGELFLCSNGHEELAGSWESADCDSKECFSQDRESADEIEIEQIILPRGFLVRDMPDGFIIDVDPDYVHRDTRVDPRMNV